MVFPSSEGIDFQHEIKVEDSKIWDRKKNTQEISNKLSRKDKIFSY